MTIEVTRRASPRPYSPALRRLRGTGRVLLECRNGTRPDQELEPAEARLLWLTLDLFLHPTELEAPCARGPGRRRVLLGLAVLAAVAGAYLCGVAHGRGW